MCINGFFSFSLTKQFCKIEILAALMQIDLGYLLQMQMQSRDKIYVCRVCKTYAQCKLKIFLNVKVYKNVVFISHSRVTSTRYLCMLNYISADSRCVCMQYSFIFPPSRKEETKLKRLVQFLKILTHKKSYFMILKSYYHIQ